MAEIVEFAERLNQVMESEMASLHPLPVILLLAACLGAAPAAQAIELLVDPGFELPAEVDEAGGFWTWVFGNEPMPTVNATADPLTGAEHAELRLDTSQLFTTFGPTIRHSASVGFGALADLPEVTDLTGRTLTVSNNYKVTALAMNSPDAELAPSVLVRNYLAYYSDTFGFLGFGGIDEVSGFAGDLYPEGVNDSYQGTTYNVTVPDFGTPVTAVDWTIGLIAPTTDSGQMTGTATVLFDDASLELVIPLPGDFNVDGVVDAADYTVWRDNSGAADEATLAGNGDGLNGVDQGDYLLWRDNYGQSAGGPDAATAIPEPATATALFLAVAFVFGSAPCRRHVSA